MALIWSGGTNL